MPFATNTLARNAILNLFTTAWNAQTPPVPLLLYDDQKKDTPKDAAEWARIQVKHSGGAQATLSGETGSQRFTHSGLITVGIYSKFGDGLSRNDILVQVAIEAFQGKRPGLDTVLFTNVRENEIGETGIWYLTNVLAEFQWDSVK